jgi:autoinducer 2-degrading protein
VYAIYVTVHIKPEFREPFLESMLDDARGSVNDEPGCFRFDVLQDDKDPNTIYLYEVYHDQAAFDAHLVAPHYIRWRDTVKDWFDRPNQVTRITPIFPAPADWKK